MRKLLLALAAATFLISPAHAQKTKANLITEVNTNFPDNTTGLITPAILRATVTDMINSWYGLVDTTNSGTGQVTAGGFALSTVPAASILTMSGTYVNLLSTDANEQIFLGTQAVDPSIIFRATQYLWQTQTVVGVAALTTGTSATLTVGRGSGNQLGLFSAPSGSGVSVFATGTDTNINLGLQSKGSGNVNILNNGGSNQIGQFFQVSANPVNFVAMGANAAGSAAQINAFGADANITLSLFPKGTGAIFVGPGTNSAALSFGGVTSGIVTMQVQAAAGTYNFNLPTTAGSTNQVLTSQGGGSTAMTWQSVATGNPVQTVTKQVFTASGTYTPHAGLISAILECVGGGGGGGGTAGVSGQNNFGGGGASGGYSRATVTAATIGASKTVTIGTAGSGGAAGNNSGTGGGASCITSTSCVSGQIVSANGGGAGTFGMTGAPASGGAAGTGDIAAAGNPGGMPASAVTTAFNPMVGGASSYFGGGAPPPTFVSATALNGIAAGNYGSGGSGGFSQNTASSSAGGNGSAGICIVTEFNNQ